MLARILSDFNHKGAPNSESEFTTNRSVRVGAPMFPDQQEIEIWETDKHNIDDSNIFRLKSRWQQQQR